MALWEGKLLKQRRFHEVGFKFERPERGGSPQHLHDNSKAEQEVDEYGNEPNMS